MSTIISAVFVLFARKSIFEFIGDLWNGELTSWIALGAILATIAFFIIYKQVTGKDFVKSKKERRAARRRRKIVLWEYERDD